MNPTADPPSQPQSQPTADASRPRSRGRFVSEGQFFAFPLVVPDECEPIPDDAAFIERIAASPCGRWVHGVTAGPDRRLFTALFKAAARGIVNLGPLAPDAEPVSIHHGLIPEYQRPAVVLGLNRPDGFELRRQRAPMVDDAIQEPGYSAGRPRTVAHGPDQRLFDAAPLPDSETIACLCASGVMLADAETGRVERLGHEVTTDFAAARFARLADRLVWLKDPGHVADCDPDAGRVRVQPLTTALPDEPLATWTAIGEGHLLAVMRGGGVWRIEPGSGNAVEVGRAPLGPVQCAAVLPDGRIYAMCGEDVAQFCRIVSDAGESEPLGAVASALIGKRYGFNFADAAVTREGVAFFAEHDRGGHLWAYYPPLAGGP